MSSTRFVLATASLTLALTASADDFGSLPSLEGFGQLGAPSAPAAAPAVVVPVAPSSSGTGTVYYDDGSTVYGSDGSTATRYGNMIHVVPDADQYLDE